MDNVRELIREWIDWKSRQAGREYYFKDLAADADVSPTYLSNIMTGTRNPGRKTIGKIAGALGLGMAEFYKGPGNGSDLSGKKAGTRENVQNLQVPAVEKAGPEKHKQSFGLHFDGLYRSDQQKLFSRYGFPDTPDTDESMEKSLSDDAVAHAGRETLRNTIPLLDEPPSPDWQEWPSVIAGKVHTSIKRFTGPGGRHAFAFRVRGKSMVPDIAEGDILVIDPEKPFTDFSGRVGVAMTNGTFLVRRIYRQEDSYLLAPANPEFEPQFVPRAETTVFRVVLWLPKMDALF